VVQTGLGIKGDPISKTANTKRADGAAQVVEHLPSQREFKPHVTRDKPEWFWCVTGLGDGQGPWIKPHTAPRSQLAAVPLVTPLTHRLMGPG
jgi:hypothetical protein